MGVIAGGAMGALVGLLIGLSQAPVVSTALSSLLALLVTFLGLGGAPIVKPGENIDGKLAAFCAATVIALVLGVAARANQWLAPSVSSEVAAWTSAQVPSSQAAALVAFERLGILPAGQTVAKREATPSNVGLFRSANESDCGTLAGVFPTSQDRWKAMHDLGGSWSDLAAGAQSLDDGRLEAFNKAALQLGCGR
jgi:hypothetical protein